MKKIILLGVVTCWIGLIGCNQKGNDKNRKASPLPKESVADMEHGFQLFYSCGNNQGIRKDTLKIPLNTLINLIDINQMQNDTINGMVFHNILYPQHTASNTKLNFSYAIAKGYIDASDSVVHIGLNGHEGSYIVFTPTGYAIAHRDSVLVWRKLYEDQIQINNYCGTGSGLLSQDVKDPEKGFYKGAELYYFWNDNLSNISANGEMFLTFNHGAIYREIFNNQGTDSFDIKVQTPVLIFRNDGGFLLDKQMPNRKFPYLMQALDIGHLCPPDCK